MNHLLLGLKNCQVCKVYKIKDQYLINQTIDNKRMKTMNLSVLIYNRLIMIQLKQVLIWTSHQYHMFHQNI